MCGIFGFQSNKNINIEKFIKPIEKRGPDEKNIFQLMTSKLVQQDSLLGILKMVLNHFFSKNMELMSL